MEDEQYSCPSYTMRAGYSNFCVPTPNGQTSYAMRLLELEEMHARVRNSDEDFNAEFSDDEFVEYADNVLEVMPNFAGSGDQGCNYESRFL